MLYGGPALAVAHVELYDFLAWRTLMAPCDENTPPIFGGTLRVPRVLHLLTYDRTPKTLVRLPASLGTSPLDHGRAYLDDNSGALPEMEAFSSNGLTNDQ